MISRIVDLSLRHRGMVIALAVVITAWGANVVRHARLDVFPNFAPPQVTVQTESPGLSAEQVETLVTRPLEQAMAGVGDLDSLRSESIQGLSIITATFKDSANITVARQMLGEAIADATNELPQGVKPPRMSPLTSGTMDLLKVGLTSDKLTLMQLRVIAETIVRPRLLAVPGVAGAGIFGGENPRLEVALDPAMLVAHKLTTQDVIEAARSATGVRGAGFIETSAQRIVIQSHGQSLTPEAIGAVAVGHHVGANVRLRDVARITVAPEPRFGAALINGKQGVLISLLSQYGANTLEVTHGLEEALEGLEPTLKAQSVELHPTLFRPATFIEVAVRNITHALLIGAALVAIVLFLFMFNLRTAAISLTAIPLSLLVAMIVMDWMGMTLNTITLGGLAIAIGEVVDDAIIDVENIWRRLRENAASPTPRPAFAVVYDASIEVRSAVVYATFVVCLVFVPVLTVPGLQGRLFSPLAMAYILAVLASLAVALTLTPALALMLLRPSGRAITEPWLVRTAKAAYVRLLRLIIGFPTWVAAGAFVLVIVAALIGRAFGGEFLPKFREGHFVLHVDLVPGSSLAESIRVGHQLTHAFQATGLIASIPQQIGRAEMAEDPWGPHRTEWHLNLTSMSGEDTDKAHEAIEHILEHMPGITTEITTFLGDRIGETISGETAAVVVNLFGDDLDALDTHATRIAQLMRKLEGAADVKLSAPPGLPQMDVRVRPDRLALYGLKPVDVLESLQLATQGLAVAQTYQGKQVTDVTVTLAGHRDSDPESLGSMLLRTPAGPFVRLADVADVDLTMGRFTVRHDGGRRRQTITCNVDHRDVSSFTHELESKLHDLTLPPGMYTHVTGVAEEREEAQRDLLTHSAFAAFAILMLLALVFHSWRNMLLVLVNLPLAFAGGVLAVALTSHTLSIGSLIGFVTLLGITMRNSIMMISHYEHLVHVEGASWGLDAVLRGSAERLLPILMTALVTALGLLPIALGAGEAGREIEGQMAIVILGGLISSTLLNLLVLPTLALPLARFHPSPSPAPQPTAP